MKKIIFLAAAALAFFGCSEKPVDGPSAKDSIELSAQSKTLDGKGGAFSVMVTSSADWTLTSTEDYSSWVTPSATTGEDGDVVKFTVAANETGADLEAVYTFTAGEAHENLVIKSLAKEVVALEVDQTEIVLDHNRGEISLNVTTDANYRDINAVVDLGSAEAQWLKYVVALPGENGSGAVLKLSYEALAELDDRSATVTVSTEGAADVEINVLQEAKHVLYTDGTNFTASMDGETVAIPVISNVAYKIEITSETSGWISHAKKENGSEYFTVSALQSGKRAAVVTFTQTDAKDGEEPLVASVNVTQIETLIRWAADMTGNRLFPKWEGEPIGTLMYFTMEAMVYFDDFDKAAGGIMTIMGIEGKYLLRMGDVGNSINHLQVATAYGNHNYSYDFQPKKWYHLAVSFANGVVTLFVDGTKIEEHDFTFMSSVNLSPAWSYEPDGNRCFWMGYSYDSNRDIHGKMTEIRIWRNKALTEADLQEPNHFYSVDPKTPFLFSYWKFTQGSGATVEDATGRGNTLYGETDVRNQGRDNKGDAGIDWVEVALPDK